MKAEPGSDLAVYRALANGRRGKVLAIVEALNMAIVWAYDEGRLQGKAAPSADAWDALMHSSHDKFIRALKQWKPRRARRLRVKSIVPA